MTQSSATTESPKPDEVRSPLTLYFPHLTLLLTGAFMVSISWQKWIDPLIDFGVQPYLAWRLNEGDVLYQDMDYFFGPLAPYTNALLFEIFGTSLQILTWFNLILIAGLTAIIFALFQKMGSRLTATLAGAGFLTLSAFSQYLWMGNYNFIVSYVYDLTYGTSLAFLTLLSFTRYVENGRSRSLALTGFLAGLIFLTKLEITLATLGPLFFGALLVLKVRSVPPGEGVRQFFLFILIFLTPSLALVLYQSTRMTFENALVWLASPFSILLKGSIQTQLFYQRVMGTESPQENLIAMGLGLAAIVGGLGLLLLLYRVLGKRIPPGPLSWLVSLLAAGGIYQGLAQPYLLQMLRPLPLICLFGAGLAFVRVLKNSGDARSHVPDIMLLVYSLFSFFMLLKIMLNVHLYHYGVVLALPAILLSFKLLIDDLPRWADTQNIAAAPLRQALSFTLVMILLGHVGISQGFYSKKAFPISEGPDSMIGYHPEVTNRDFLFRIALDDLRGRMKTGDTLIVIPTGTMFNYLTRSRKPGTPLNFNPVTLGKSGEGEVIEQLEQDRPNWVLLSFHDYLEFETRFFGRDFGKTLYKWIRQHYTVVNRIGKDPVQDKKYGFVLLKSNSP